MYTYFSGDFYQKDVKSACVCVCVCVCVCDSIKIAYSKHPRWVAAKHTTCS